MDTGNSERGQGAVPEYTNPANQARRGAPQYQPNQSSHQGSGGSDSKEGCDIVTKRRRLLQHNLSCAKSRQNLAPCDKLNRHVWTQHFKMESIRTVKSLIQQGDWLLKLDLKDAYLSVPMCQEHQKYLKFQFQGQSYQFQALPFGLSSAPHMFTKLMKPLLALLGGWGSD